MRKIFGILVCTLVLITKVYAKDDIPTEKQYTFDRENVATVLAEFIEDEKLALKAAERYNELSREGGEKISAVDFVDVCVVGGMNIKATDGSGYTKCLEMFMRLIEMQNLDAGGFDMYCPATGNALKSITDKTQVGDVCGGTPDTYIEYGHVTLKTDDKNGQHKYVCTCTPQSCKDGYYWNKEKYQCSVKDKEGYCVRHILGSYEYKNGKLPTDSGVGLNDWNKRNNAYYNDKYAQINASTDAFNRCVEYGANQGCRIRGALASADVSSGFGTAKKYQVICNPENYEIAADKKVQEDKEKKHKAELEQNTSYYEVCGKKDKGKGECIDNVFTRKIIGGTQVSYAVGNALVKEYMRVKGYNGVKDEITCGGDSYDKNIRKSGTEYFIKCKSLKDLTKYYEFKFDDLEESKDLTANTSVYNAVWHIIYNYNIAKNSHNGYDTGTKANCDAVNATFKKICNGCGTEWRESGYIETKGKKFCYDVINIADNTTCKKSPNDLNTAFDIDPFVFCKNTHNQLKNTGSMESLLKQYISDKSGYNVSKIECYPQTLCYSGTGCGGVIGHGDDIKTCVVHGDKDYTVDFVFDDVNEFSKKLSEVSMDAMQCVIGGNEISITLGFELDAKNKGKKCTGLDDKLCKDLDKMIRNRGGSGAHYDTKKRACILNSAEEYATQELAQNVAIGAVVAVGTSLFVIGSGGVGAALIVGGSMFAVDTAVNGGLYIVEKLEDGQAGRRFTRFINAAKKCKDSKCAQLVIEQNYNDLNAVVDELNFEDATEFQTELERLLDLMDVCRMDDDGTVYMGTKDGDCLLAIRQLNLASENKSLQYASFGLMIGDFAFNPASAFSKVLSRGGKLARIFQKVWNADKATYKMRNFFKDKRIVEAGEQLVFDGVEVFTGTTGYGKVYYRIPDVFSDDETVLLVNYLQKEGWHITSSVDKDGRFIAVSREDIRDAFDWNNDWLSTGRKNISSITNKVDNYKDITSMLYDYENNLAKIQSNNFDVASYSKTYLTENEWKQLNSLLEQRGINVKFVEDGLGNMSMVRTDVQGIKQNVGYVIGEKYISLVDVYETHEGDVVDYVLIHVDKVTANEINKMIDNLQKAGYRLALNADDKGRFIAASKQKVSHFDDWWGPSNVKNWLPTGVQSDIRYKIYPDFDERVNAIKNGSLSEFFITRNKLSNEEFQILKTELKQEGVELTEFSDGLFRVGKPNSATSIKSKAYNLDGLDEAHSAIVNRLGEITGTTWEYVAPDKYGSYGKYRINRTKLSKWTDEATAIENKLKHENVKFEYEIDGPNQYLVIREENIDDIGKIKPISVLADETKKTGAEFLGKLKGWNVESIETVKETNFRNSVFRFTENNSGKVYYLKHVPDMDEIKRTKRAYEILDGKSDIVHTVKVVEDDQNVLIDFAAKNDLLKTSGEYWLLIEEVPSSKAAWELLADGDSLNEVLQGKSITIAEQKEISKAIERLNSSGVIHGDLEHNMFFMREPNGRLRVDIIDYEIINSFTVSQNDKTWLKKTFDKLADAGLAEVK